MAHRFIEAPRTPQAQLDARMVGRADDPGTWVGISPNDRWILGKHLERGLCRGWELYFAVPATAQAMPYNVALTPAVIRMASLLWPHRMDLVAVRGPHHWIIEIKPCASYLALGQVLFYSSRAPDCWSCLAGAGLAVLTDCSELECRCVFREHGVVVHELGEEDALPIGNIKT